MDTPILFALLLSISVCLGSHEHHSHTIPVEGYETELQDLGQHVEVPETPVRVIKITKTIAVKIPVPYPVKVIEKVPYPVHVNKPYPVPVPQIIKVPQPAAPGHVHGQQHQQPLDIAHNTFQHLQADANSYQVHDNSGQNDHYEINNHDDDNSGNSYSGSPSTDYSSDESPNSHYNIPKNFYGEQDGHFPNVDVNSFNPYDHFAGHNSQH